MRSRTMLLLALLTVLSLGCERGPDAGHDTGTAGEKAGTMAENMETTPSGLQYVDVKVGTGASPQKGQTAVRMAKLVEA